MGCAVALKILEVVVKEGLADNARQKGEYLQTELRGLVKQYPGVLMGVRGLGLMLGFELSAAIPAFAGARQAASLQVVQRLHAAGLLAIPAGNQVIRLLPPLNLSQPDAEEALRIIENVLSQLAS